jgi:hypothetical protein
MKITFYQQFVFGFLLLTLTVENSFLNSRVSAQENAAGTSGFYNSLVVGIDKDSKTLTGFFSEQTGWNEITKSPMFNCELFIYGEFQGNKYKIRTWYPGEKESITGELRFVETGGKTIEIKLEKEPGGCGNVHPFSREVGEDKFPLDEKGAWSAVRVVSAKKAYFYSRPVSSARKKSYVVRHDSVRLFKSQKGWAEVEFGTDKKTRGWLKESDLFPANSPN